MNADIETNDETIQKEGNNEENINNAFVVSIAAIIVAIILFFDWIYKCIIDRYKEWKASKS